jgi:hypothetical protein
VAAAALVLSPGPASAQELLADLVGSARACLTNPNNANSAPLLAEGAAVCGAELRIRDDEIRFGAETARAMPRSAAAWSPASSPRCVNAGAVPPDPPTYNCSFTVAQDPLYSQCVVELLPDTGPDAVVGDGGRAMNEAACLLRRPITFQVRNPRDSADPIKFEDRVSVVECLAYRDATGADRDAAADLALGEPVNVCTAGVGERDETPADSELAAAANGWRVRARRTSRTRPSTSPPWGTT